MSDSIDLKSNRRIFVWLAAITACAGWFWLSVSAEEAVKSKPKLIFDTIDAEAMRADYWKTVEK